MYNKFDLSEIPERFHIIFNSDWSKGNDSNMKMQDRIICHETYLEYNKWQIQKAIIKSTSTKEEDKPVGFVKD